MVEPGLAAAAMPRPRHKTGPLAAPGHTPRVDAVSHQEWDSLLDLFEDVNYEQTSIFTARMFGADNTHCAVVIEDGQLLGGICYGMVRVPMIGAVGFCKVGPVWRPAGEEADATR